MDGSKACFRTSISPRTESRTLPFSERASIFGCLLTKEKIVNTGISKSAWLWGLLRSGSCNYTMIEECREAFTGVDKVREFYERNVWIFLPQGMYAHLSIISKTRTSEDLARVMDSMGGARLPKLNDAMRTVKNTEMTSPPGNEKFVCSV